MLKRLIIIALFILSGTLLLNTATRTPRSMTSPSSASGSL